MDFVVLNNYSRIKNFFAREIARIDKILMNIAWKTIYLYTNSKKRIIKMIKS